MFLFSRRQPGQAVIEYAGAIVMATFLVAAVLSVLPGDFMSYFGDIIEAAAQMIRGFMNDLM